MNIIKTKTAYEKLYIYKLFLYKDMFHLLEKVPPYFLFKYFSSSMLSLASPINQKMGLNNCFVDILIIIYYTCVNWAYKFFNPKFNWALLDYMMKYNISPVGSCSAENARNINKTVITSHFLTKWGT